MKCKIVYWKHVMKNVSKQNISVTVHIKSGNDTMIMCICVTANVILEFFQTGSLI